MAGKKGNKNHANKTSFTSESEKGNKNAEVWGEKAVKELLTLMRDNAENSDDILCLQDAIRSVNLYSSSLDYLLGKYPIFLNIKKDIQNIIVSRINRGALYNDLNSTAGIWRMKQLGEIDSRDIKQDVKIKGAEKLEITYEDMNED